MAAPKPTPSFQLRSRWSIPIPETDLNTFLFNSPTAPLSKTPVLFDAENAETRQLSCHSYRSLVKKIARGLQVAGLKKGDRVLMFSGNTVCFPAIYLGIVAAGGIFTGANPTFTTRELAFQLENSGASWLIANTATIEIALSAAETAGVQKSNVFAFDNSLLCRDGQFKWENRGEEARKKYGVRHWSEIVSDSETFEWEKFTTLKESDTTATINYSSGTTGVPKGVELSHRNFIANCRQVLVMNELSPEMAARDKRWLGMLPMYHAYGQTYYVMTLPALNQPTYVIPKFDFVQFLGYIQKFKITSITGVPPILTALAKHPVVDKFDLSSVHTIGCGAAPLSSEVEKTLETRMEKYGIKLRIRQGWGMTEATCSILGFHPEDNFADDSGSVGELLANCSAKITNPSSGASLPANTPGELQIRGPNICKGYYNNPSATAEIMAPDGWMRTGDIAYYDATGKFYIVDRMKELIKVRGNQVAPAELEGLLLDHPKILDAAVIGVPVNGDEGPRAYVVKQPGMEIGGEEVMKWVQERATRYKWITGGVMFVEEIPKNPSGKIMRKVIREWAKRDSGVKAKI